MYYDVPVSNPNSRSMGPGGNEKEDPGQGSLRGR